MARSTVPEMTREVREGFVLVGLIEELGMSIFSPVECVRYLGQGGEGIFSC